MNEYLNNSQKQATEHTAGPCFVIAGPGSGKTAVITQRTKNLIQKCGVNPGNILVITFTKAAAMEMKQRFLAMMGTDSTSVTFGTFHAVFFMVLKMAYHFDNSNILSEEMKYQMMRDIVAHHHLEYRDENEFIGNLLGEISRVKNERIDLLHFYSSQCGEEIFRSIYREYEKRRTQHRLLDFDDMLVYTYELFSERKDILSAWQKKYTYILIDEFQDINRLQMDIVRMLALPENNLFVVGDDDQSIYRFRGSKPELMLQFANAYPDSKKILLDINYRSDAYITQAALRLISHNKERFDKSIQNVKERTRPVKYEKYPDQKSQNIGIIRTIEKGIREEGRSLSDYAVLFRTNTQPRLMSEQLMAYNISFRTKERIPNLYEHWIARDILTYLRIAGGSRARADFLQIMNRPKRYIGRDLLCESEIDFDEWMKLYDEQPWVAERIERLWYDVNALSKMSPYAAINYIRKGIGYDEYLKEYAKYRNISFDELWEVVEELHQTAKGYQNYEAWMEHIREYSDELKKIAVTRSGQTDAVTLATLHSSKGLEFPVVIIADVNEGIMPYKKAVLERDIEEERRLFYVGMTRAKEELILCYVESAKDKEMIASRFIKESQED